MNKMMPVIKWSGSKRSQAERIVALFPKFNTYFEPFLGGGSILYQTNPRIAICGDICPPLIDLWNEIKINPDKLYMTYKEDWTNLQKQGHTYYYDVRTRFNKNQNGNDLLFLSRTCVNGLIRFNKNGEFNNSLHHTRKGINPDKLKKIIRYWSDRIKNTTFICSDYKDITKSAKKGDFIYLDPPYFGTVGRYYGQIQYNEFIDYLHDLNKRSIKYALSLDGKRADVEYLIDLPEELYKRHILLNSGNSSFKKVMDKKNQQVQESLYLSWDSEFF